MELGTGLSAVSRLEQQNLHRVLLHARLVAEKITKDDASLLVGAVDADLATEGVKQQEPTTKV